MSWTADSIMARKGLAKGQVRSTHSITEADQGKYHYVYGPYVDPVLTVDPGAVVSAETHDAFEGKIQHETDRPSEILNFPFLNPQNGRSLSMARKRATRSLSISRASFRAVRSRAEPRLSCQISVVWCRPAIPPC